MGSMGDQGHFRQLKFAIDTQPSCSEFCGYGNEVLRVAWAVVLRCFTGSDAIVLEFAEGAAKKNFLLRFNISAHDTVKTELKRPPTLLDEDGTESVPVSMMGIYHVEEEMDMGMMPGVSTMEANPSVSFYVNECNDVLGGTLWYSTDKISTTQARHWIATLKRALEELVTYPDRKISDLNLFTDLDFERIRKWNPSVPPRIHKCVHHLISERCAQQPQETAISAWDGEMSFLELDQRSSQLAQRITHMGVSPGSSTALLFDKSKWAIVAMLAVMKAGSAFVFLDPSYPIARLEAINESLTGSLVLASASQLSLAQRLSRDVLVIDSSDDLWAHTWNTSWSLPTSQPADVLYTVYTSGATGKPKGVVVEHGAFSTRALHAGPPLKLDQKPRVLQFGAFVFSGSHRDILSTLIWGGCLCIPSEQERKNDPSAFIRAHRVSWAALTPSTLSVMTPAQVPTLEVLVVFGEPMSLSSRNVWADHVHLMGLYGLSEGAGGNALQPDLSRTTNHRDVGYGIASNVWLVDVDDADRLAPVGATGQIVLESHALARGYVNHVGKANHAFSTDLAWLGRFRGKETGVLYQTGDLGRYDAETGALIFIGRKELTQVKVHGKFVDLLDLESCLSSCMSAPSTSSWQALAVHVTPLGGDAARIVACVDVGGTSVGDSIRKSNTMSILPTERVPEVWASAVKELTTKLSALLPAHMIPYAFIPVHNGARTITGKIDRRTITDTLARLSMAQMQEYVVTSHIYEEPTDATEIRLAELWRYALRQEAVRIGRSSNLFELGGDSVTAMRLVGLARNAGLKLSVDEIFRHPTLEQQAQASSKLTAGDRESAEKYVPWSLIDAKTRASVLDHVRDELAISPSQVEDVYPCTALQQEMMAAASKSPAAYSSRSTFRLPGDVVEERYWAAWDAVVQAHPILRTRIVQVGQQTLQVVVAEAHFPRKTHASLKEATCSPKDSLGSMTLGSPLFSLALVREGTDSRSCVLTMHHAIYDLWSLDVLLDEVERNYNHSVPLLPTPFAPFLRHLQRGAEVARKYWQASLADYDGPVFPRLPSAGTTPQPKSTTPTRTLSWRPAYSNRITLSTLARLAWAMTIRAFSGANDIAFGAVVTGRGANVPGIERMTGPTVATVPLRMKLNSLDGTVASVAEAIQETSLQMMPHEQLGISGIRKLGEGAQEACKFQSLLVVQAKTTSPQTSQTLHERQPESVDRLQAFLSHALTVLCEQESATSSVEIRIIFDQNIVDPDHAQAYLDLFLHFLSVITTNPQQPLSDIPSVTPHDLQILQSWNRSKPEPCGKHLADLLPEQEKQQRDKEAVCAWDGSLSYTELLQTSQGLAAHLQSQYGLVRTDVVAIIMTRGQKVPVAMLATMMTGATFTLLDSSLPPKRIRMLLDIVSPKAILHNVPGLDDQLQMGHVDFLKFDETLAISDLRRCAAPTPVTRDPQDCLYIAWTSGSTGVPKAVMISHQSYIIAAKAYADGTRLQSSSRVLQFASHSFDASILELLTPLMMGGTVCIPSDSDRSNRVAAVVVQFQVNYLFLTPTVARLLQPETLPSLQAVVLGGEPIYNDDISRWKNIQSLAIAYGPTECSAITSVCSDPRELDAAHQENLMGISSAGSCWLVHPRDPEMLAPLGGVGELLIEGAIVGLGYHPNTTESKPAFIDSPKWLRKFRGGYSSRVYRTGDLVQFGADGHMRYVARKDAQRKINGVRIEMAEVEQGVRTALAECSWVGDVVAEIVQLCSQERKLLVAFIHVKKGAPFPIEGGGVDQRLIPASRTFAEFCGHLRSRLQETLPKAVVPSLILPMESLPQTPSQKVDRKQLQLICLTLSEADLSHYTRASEDEQRLPSTKQEQVLFELVQQVLKISVFGMTDKFLDLGGDSVAAMLLSSLSRQLQMPLTVAQILSPVSLERLAKNILQNVEDDQSTKTSSQRLGRAKHPHPFEHAAAACGLPNTSSVEDEYPCTPWQEFCINTTRAKQGALVGNFGFLLPRHADIFAWRQAWYAVYCANPILRTRIIKAGSDAYQVVLREGFWWRESGDDEKAALHVDFGRALSCLEVSTMSDGRTKIALVIHHSLYDGYSLPLIRHQVEAAYRGQKPAPCSFLPFIDYLSNIDSKKAETFWKANLEGFRAPALGVPQGETHEVRAMASLRRTITITSFSATKATAISLAWGLALVHCSRSSDICFLFTTWGRDAPVANIENLTGPTIGVYPLRINLSTKETMLRTQTSLQNQMHRTINFQNYGLEKIARISPSAAEACDSAISLTIHAPPSSPSDSEELMEFQPSRRQNEGVAFDVLAVDMQVTPVSGSCLRANMDYDESVVSSDEARELMERFLFGLEMLQDMRNLEGLRVGDIVGSGDGDFMMLDDSGISLKGFEGTYRGT